MTCNGILSFSQINALFSHYRRSLLCKKMGANRAHSQTLWSETLEHYGDLKKTNKQKRPSMTHWKWHY